MPAIDVLLARSGPLGVFLRFVHRHTGRDDLFTVRGEALVASGMPARVYVVRQHWLLAADAEPDDARALLAETLADPRAQLVYVVGPEPAGPLPEGWDLFTDLVFTGEPELVDGPEILSGAEFLAALHQLDPELAEKIPPPAIREQLPFRFHGLVHEGRIVSICDTTVDDGEWVVIQQAHTVERLRGRGLSTALVRGVLRFAHEQGRRVVWVCDAQNAASRAVATRVGLLLHAEVPLLVRSAKP